MSRTLGLTLGVTGDDLIGPGCIVKLGFAPPSEDFKKMMYVGGRPGGIWTIFGHDSYTFVAPRVPPQFSSSCNLGKSASI